MGAQHEDFIMSGHPASRDHRTRAAAVVLAVAVSIAIPAVQAIGRIGLSPAQFAAQGDATLRAAPYAFGVWALIYIGLIAFAVYQCRGSVRRSALMDAVGWPAAAGILGCGLWILVSAANLQWLSILVLMASAASLITGLGRARTARASAALADRLLALWPLFLLTGWLTVASALNIVTVLTAQGVISPAIAWAVGAILATLVVAAALGWRLASAVYLAPIAWGLIGVAVAERLQPLTAGAAASAAAVLVLEAVWLARRPLPRLAASAGI